MKLNIPILSEAAHLALEDGYRYGSKHCFRTRCFIVLLRAEGRSTVDVGDIVKKHPNSVNKWLVRYKTLGIEGLQNKAGQGRPGLISVAEDGEKIKELVKEHRQRVSVAQADWEESKEEKTAVSRATFRRFLKELADDISVSASVVKGEKA